MIKGSGRIPTCHPDRKHRAHGLCGECYLKQYWKSHRPAQTTDRIDGINYRKTPTCHPERKHKARGLCKPCYDKLPDVAERIKAYTQAHSRRDQLKHRYGITPEEYNTLLEQQGGVCAICKRPPRGKMKRLSVDHNHFTEQVRGLLCITCNRTVGYLENTTWLEQAQSYLAKY